MVRITPPHYSFRPYFGEAKKPVVKPEYKAGFEIEPGDNQEVLDFIKEYTSTVEPNKPNIAPGNGGHHVSDNRPLDPKIVK